MTKQAGVRPKIRSVSDGTRMGVGVRKRDD